MRPRLHERLNYVYFVESLVISPFTVKSHAGNIYEKLGTSGRRKAIARARSMGLIAG